MLGLSCEENMYWINLAQGFYEHMSGTSLPTGITDYKFLGQMNKCLLLGKELGH
jgi:hypothetical protein